MINMSKERELAEKRQEALYSVANSLADDRLHMDFFAGPPAPPTACFSFSCAPPPPAPCGAALAKSAAPQPSPASFRGPPVGGRRSERRSASGVKPASSVSQSTTSVTSTCSATKKEKMVTAAPSDRNINITDIDTTSELHNSNRLRDYTKVPAMLDSRFETLGKGNVIRPTIIHPGTEWQRKSQKSLLSKPSESVLGSDEHKSERNKAFDLLDALTRSGALTVDHASLHIVMVATHCFDKTLLATVIQDNINPIEKVEQTTLVMATTIHNQPVEDLVKPNSLIENR